MRLYLDCCCYNRPFDGSTQARLQQEADAVKKILNGWHCILGSDFLDMEISMISDIKKLSKVRKLYEPDEHIDISQSILDRAKELQAISTLHDMDSSHIAAAEAGHADAFLTVDDRLIRSCKGLDTIRIVNPVEFLKEVENNDE